MVFQSRSHALCQLVRPRQLALGAGRRYEPVVRAAALPWVAREHSSRRQDSCDLGGGGASDGITACPPGASLASSIPVPARGAPTAHHGRAGIGMAPGTLRDDRGCPSRVRQPFRQQAHQTRQAATGFRPRSAAQAGCDRECRRPMDRADSSASTCAPSGRSCRR